MGFHQISFETTQVLSSFLDSRGLRHTGAINANGIYPFVWLLTAPKGHYQFMARTLRCSRCPRVAKQPFTVAFLSQRWFCGSMCRTGWTMDEQTGQPPGPRGRYQGM